MQQRLAVASILVLALLTGASAVLIQSHINAQSAQNSPAQTIGAHSSSTTVPSNTPTNSTSSNGSLLTNGNHSQTNHDDGNETEHELETETEYPFNSTMDT